MAEPGRRLSPNLTAVLVLVVLAVALLAWQRPWQSSSDDAAEIPADAAIVLADQFNLLSQAGDEKQFVAAAGSTQKARTFAKQAWAARSALDAAQVDLRYVSGGEVADHADGSTSAEVEVSWEPGDDSALTESGRRTSTVTFRMAPQGDGTFAVQGVTRKDGPLPLWLAGRLTIDSSDDAVVIRVDGGDEDLPLESMIAKARADVARVVPEAEGPATIVSAHTERQMAALVGQPAADVDQIAAVTTSLDGRSGTATRTVIVLNPKVFATVDARAAQVVLSHEATHLLTDAAGSSAEKWVIEGFADFVALHDDSAPLSLSAGQVLGKVKAGTGPTRLPTAADFGATADGLGGVYESAWMIFRMLGEQHSDADIVAFYDAVRGGTPVGTALKSAFGLTVKQLTSEWLAYLTKSASTVS